MKVAEEDQKYTGFSFEGICYVFCRVPFGLRNSGAALIRCVDQIIQGRMPNRVTTYVDDIVVQAGSIDQHFQDLQELFQILQENNLVQAGDERKAKVKKKVYEFSEGRQYYYACLKFLIQN